MKKAISKDRPRPARYRSSVTSLIFVFCVLNFVGCAGLKETAKGIAGISTKEVEKSRPGALKKDFNLSYEICYDRILKDLKRIGAYVYATDKSKNLVAIYVSETDTTCVGVFFTPIDANNTQVEIASLSTYAKELIAGKLFKQKEEAAHEEAAHPADSVKETSFPEEDDQTGL